jgi:hypothetical protein
MEKRAMNWMRMIPVLLCAGLFGCGGSDGVGQVEGKVSYQGKPILSGTVTFTSIDPKKPAGGGGINPDGTYFADGVPTGECKVTVTSPGAPAGSGGRGAGGRSRTAEKPAAAAAAGPAGWFAIPDTLSDPTKSTIKKTIKSGKNTGIDIDFQ